MFVITHSISINHSKKGIIKMLHQTIRIRTNMHEYKICEHCKGVNWHENNVCISCKQSKFKMDGKFIQQTLSRLIDNSGFYFGVLEV